MPELVSVTLTPEDIQLLTYQLDQLIKRAEKRKITPDRVLIIGGLKSIKAKLQDAVPID